MTAVNDGGPAPIVVKLSLDAHGLTVADYLPNDRLTAASGQPPTGKRFEIKGMDMVRVRGGQVVEHWARAEPL